jgi:hypothetical protein
MKNLVNNFQLKSYTRWVYTNHPDWCDDPEFSVLNVKVERITTLNNEIISKKVIESQDHVLRISAPESMAAEACLKMNSTYMDKEVYVGF